MKICEFYDFSLFPQKWKNAGNPWFYLRFRRSLWKEASKKMILQRENRKYKKDVPQLRVCVSRHSTGVPEVIRTPDLPLRRRSLYPAELRKHRNYKKSANKAVCGKLERVMGIEDRKSRIISGFQIFQLPNIVWQLSGSIIKKRLPKQPFCSQFAPVYELQALFDNIHTAS